MRKLFLHSLAPIRVTIAEWLRHQMQQTHPGIQADLGVCRGGANSLIAANKCVRENACFARSQSMIQSVPLEVSDEQPKVDRRVSEPGLIQIEYHGISVREQDLLVVEIAMQ